MQVRMLRARTLLDVGVERPLDLGQVYDLPEVVATSLIATGAAEHVRERDARMEHPPETRPLRAPEMKRGRQ